MDIDETNLTKDWKSLDPINLSNQVDVGNNNQICILQHPFGNIELKTSFSNCMVVGEYIIK